MTPLRDTEQKEKALLHCHSYSAEIVNHITSLVLILIIQIACGFVY